MLPEKIAGEGYRRQHVIAVVAPVADGEHRTRRNQRVLDESLGRIHHVELPLALGRIYLQVSVPVGGHAQVGGQTYAHRTVLEVGGAKRELAVAVKNLVNMRQLVEIIVNTLHHNHCLIALVNGQSLVLHAFSGYVDFRQRAYLGQHGVVSRSSLAFGGHYLELRVERCKERRHQVMEAVEHAQRDHQSHGGDGHTYGAYAAYQVDYVRALLREQVPTGYVKGEVHFFSNSSMWAM